ncbi:2-phospho-L-lactate transferase [Archaeoglobus veneficus]|uniref:2-phospho-L-lactate transferase n=1 Tax=Archaeoglobus veneficus (strain DSM 11195 / SNP6) TaxID=693661 RepID=F2KP43_ARCVS|nr:2-phospho-L-lactate transferase [Archaeoglobus veneficus]AEA46351.1 LPPG:FO 2-phospho-L-lactate transferase [Archaeoglobus veneficus SNP6]
MISVLSGGTGTPKLIRGMKDLCDFAVIVNTAEDVWVSGNKVCPDIDSVIYALADVIDDGKWWGIKNDTFTTHEALKKLGFDEMLMIGDKDRATHILRSEMLRRGYTLTAATRELAKRYGIKNDVLPMCEEDVATYIVTPEGEMHFQEFWVKRRGEAEVVDVVFRGIEEARMTEDVEKAIKRSKAVVIGPSNPITSIMPILSVKGLRELLRKKTVLSVSPIIGSKPVSGPAAKLMRAKGYEVSPSGVVDCYSDFLDIFVVDESDRVERDIEVVKTNILMKNKEDEKRLAKFVLDVLGV